MHSKGKQKEKRQKESELVRGIRKKKKKKGLDIVDEGQIDSEFEREAVSTVSPVASPLKRPVRFSFHSALNGRALSI